jgi:hypothetical protein
MREVSETLQAIRPVISFFAECCERWGFSAAHPSSGMAMTEACDRLWAAPTIDQESSAYTYTSSRPKWRTKVLGPTVVVEESNRTEQPRPRPTTTCPPLLVPHSVCHSAMDTHP